MDLPEARSPIRISAIVIAVAAGMVGGRVLATAHPLGVNDRSRWATVRALVDEGTYAIGRRDPSRASEQNPYGEVGISVERGWDTIDKVLQPDTQVYYSSKPPLLPTLVAGEYWLLKNFLGWEITDPSGPVIRTILLTVNWLPFVLYLIVADRLAVRFVTTAWGRVYLIAAAAFATFVTPFAITLNNHSIAAYSALFAVAATVAALGGGQPGAAEFGSDGSPPPPGAATTWLVAGFFAAFSACNELPALALTALLFVVLFVRSPLRALTLFAPAAALPIAAFLITNHAAIGKWSPAYTEQGSSWYQYPGSYWDPGPDKGGLDWAAEAKTIYACHLLLGHHGLFSLTPIFLLAPVGILWCTLRPRPATARSEPVSGPGEDSARSSFRFTMMWSPQCLVAFITVAVTIPVLAYLILTTNNYGGMSCGPRWLIWLSPLLLFSMSPVLDWLSRTSIQRGIAYVLLAISVASVSYPAANPWTDPWLYDFMDWQGWLHY